MRVTVVRVTRKDVEARRTPLARLLRDLRSTRGISQEQLAERVGVSAGFIGGVESGRRMPSAEVLDTIADSLELTKNERADLLAARPTTIRDTAAPSVTRRLEVLEQHVAELRDVVQRLLASESER